MSSIRRCSRAADDERARPIFASAAVESNRRPNMKRSVVLFAAALFVWTTGHALAETDAARNFPERPVRIVVPFGAGGGTDTIARVIAAKMSESFCHQV